MQKKRRTSTECVQTLQKMAAGSITSYAESPAISFARTSDPEHLADIQLMREAEGRINTHGRVPPCTIYCGNFACVRGGTHVNWCINGSLMDESTRVGARMALERSTGKLRAETRLVSYTEKGAVFRTDSLAIHEMWISALLTWDQLEEALSHKPSDTTTL